MIKETIENIRRKIKEKKVYREDMDKVYPVDYLFFGYYDKEVCEEGLSYSYRHVDCFLVNNDHYPTEVICLTGNNRNLNKPIECYTRPVPVYGGAKTIYCFDINGQSYEIDLQYNSCRYATTYAKNTSVANVQSLVNAKNYSAKETSKNRVLNEAQVKSEFSK